MDYVLEFNGYYVKDAKSNKKFQLKEYCLIPIVNGKIEHSNRKSGIVYPEYDWSQLSRNYQDQYKFNFYKKYGIEYEDGTCWMAQAIDTIIEFTGKVFKNVATLELDFKERSYVDPEICPYHVDTRRRCSVRNAISMAIWVIKNEPGSSGSKVYLKSKINQIFRSKPSHVIDKFKETRRISPEPVEDESFLNSNSGSRSDNLEHLFRAKTYSQEVNDGLKRAPKKFEYLKDSDQSDSDKDVMQLNFNFNQPKKLNYLKDDKKKARNYMDDLMEIDFENEETRNRSINNINY
ncbi:hypothetical protein KQX54_014298 [Cotesia glomerata]|uniref:Decapping nuclease n=1 Tax=Cotesia glomerata TaxID=32391 RepID=A0AAV7IPT5_COTGL|nr:hypothetical protein KQX54_014298 [Cotesia glomerata]